MNKNDKIRFIYGLITPLIFVIVMWVVKFYEYLFNEEFYRFGIFPLKFNNLPGIILSPFLHSDFNHLISNTIPFIFLGFSLFYFYRKIAFRVFMMMWVLTGFWVWLAARDSYHIGASGMVYAIASFLFFSGLIHKIKALIAISFTVVFLYGSLFWGVFPLVENMSWESHLFGGIVGFLLSLFYAESDIDKHFEHETIIFKSDEFINQDITDKRFKEVQYKMKSDIKKKEDS